MKKVYCIILAVTMCFTMSVSVMAADEAATGMMPRNSDTYYTQNCPYGSPADYEYAYTMNQKTIRVGNFVEDMTVEALAQMFALFFGNSSDDIYKMMVANSYGMANAVKQDDLTGNVLLVEVDVSYYNGNQIVPYLGGVRYVDKMDALWEDQSDNTTTVTYYKVYTIY